MKIAHEHFNIYMIFEHNYANATQAPLNNTSTSVTKKDILYVFPNGKYLQYWFKLQIKKYTIKAFHPELFRAHIIILKLRI